MNDAQREIVRRCISTIIDIRMLLAQMQQQMEEVRDRDPLPAPSVRGGIPLPPDYTYQSHETKGKAVW